MYSCWCCWELRKRYGYKGCLWMDRQPETKAMLNRLLVEIDSPLIRNEIWIPMGIESEG